MNTEQQRLVEDHMKIVYSLARKHDLPRPWGREDLVSAGYEALCRAATSYNKSHGTTFQTFAWQRVDGEIKDEIRRLKWGPRVQESGEYEAPVLMAQLPLALEGMAEDDHSYIDLEAKLATLTPRQMEMVEMRSAGMGISDIAEKYNISRGRVSQIMRQVALKLEAA